MKNNKVLPALLALGLTTGATVVPAFAEEPSTESSTVVEKGGMVTSKTAKLEDDGTYTIDLEAYATGNTFQPDPEGVPLDVVLVIDQSGSMGGNKLTKLKTAVKGFLGNLKKNADDYGVDHRISMIGYAGSSSKYFDHDSDGHTNTRLLLNGSNSSSWKSYYYKGKKGYSGYIATEGNLNDSDYKKSFHSITHDYNKLIYAADELAASGATRTDLGMKMAENVFKNNDIINADGKSSKRVTIVFTDGEPNDYNGFVEDVANTAIRTSNSIKNSYNSEVYTVGLFESPSKKVEKFLERLGSASKNATTYENGSVDLELRKKYYTLASKPEQLKSIFETIFHDVISGTEVDLNSDSVFRDIIGEGFDLPEKAIDNGNITVKTVAGSKSTNESEVVWGSEQNADSSISVAVNGNNVDITGFNYKSEFIAPTHNGRKLKVQITGVTPNDEAFNNAGTYTNGELSGIYQKPDDDKPFINFHQPKTLLTDKAYVVDYAKTIRLNKDHWKMTKINNVSGSSKSLNHTLNNKYGSFGSILDSYTPKTTKWEGIDKNYAFGKASVEANAEANNGNLWSRVSVLPANSVYYEDSFTTDEAKGTVGIVYEPGKWGVEGETQTDEYETNSVHGSWSDSSVGDTDGTAHVADAKNGVAKATFEFTGTGVDIYSRTNMKSGTIYVKVNNASGTYNKGFTIDTKSASGDYYSIPTFSLGDLPHDDYQVTLRVTTAASEGRTQYAIDGIRIYNPLNTGADANGYDEAYTGEYNAKFKNVKDLIASDSTVFIDEVVSEDGSTSTAQPGKNELNSAPLNEVYLSNGQSIVINVNNTAGEQFDKYYVGLKTPDGKAATVQVSGGEGVSRNIPSHQIKSSMDLYFEATPDNDGNITIRNTASTDEEINIISITKLRAANDNHKDGLTVFVTNSLSEESAMSSYSRFKAAGIVDADDAPKAEDEFEVEPEVTETPEVTDNETATEIEEGNVTITNPEENVVESKPNNWWNKLFGGFGSLFK